MEETKMDAVDTKQQKEITDLQKRDVAHENDLMWLRKGMAFVLFSFVLWVIASSTLIFILMEKLSQIPK